MPKYEVTVARTGYIRVMADSPEQAMEKVNAFGLMDQKCIVWADDYQATDARDVREIEG